MLYNREISFIDEFIANLKVRGIEKIPFDDADFFAGVENMAVFFNKNRQVLGEKSDELSLLFIKNPLECVYKRFRDALSAGNGAFLSFVNPDYVISILEISEDDAEFIIKKNRSELPKGFVGKCAEEFCKGANCLTVSNSN